MSEKDIQTKYNEWRKNIEEHNEIEKESGGSIPVYGSFDCGESSVREDFSQSAELDYIITFEEMLKLEENYTDPSSIRNVYERDFYGKIDFLAPDGSVAETIFYTDQKKYKDEINESSEIGRPISYKKLTLEEYNLGNTPVNEKSYIKAAEELIDKIEDEGGQTFLGKEEKDFVVNYAYQTQDLKKTERLIDYLATESYELTHGSMNPKVKYVKNVDDIIINKNYSEVREQIKNLYVGLKKKQIENPELSKDIEFQKRLDDAKQLLEKYNISSSKDQYKNKNEVER